jgi:MFS family permease
VQKLSRRKHGEPGSTDLWTPLRRPEFRRLAASYTLNELGDWLGIIALAVLVFDRTDSALATAGLFLGTRFAPALLAPMFVARVDRAPPRYALAAIYCTEAAAFGVLALLVDNFSLALVIAVATVDGTLALGGRSLTRAVVAALLKDSGELRSGNAILNLGFTSGAAIGPAVAGVILGGIPGVWHGFGVQTALLLDAISFLLIAGIMFAGTLPHAEPEEGRWRERFQAGLAYVAARVPLRRLLFAQGAAFIFFTAVIPIEVIYAKSTLGASDSGYGALLASWGIGMVLGGIVFAALRATGLPRLLLFSTIAVGIAYLGLAAAPTLLAACAISVLGGVGNGIQWVSVVSAIQEMTSTAMQARVMSVLESVGSAMPGLGYIVGGLVAEGHSPRTTFLFAGIGVLVVAAFATYFLAGTPWTRGEGAIGPSGLDQDDESDMLKTGEAIGSKSGDQGDSLAHVGGPLVKEENPQMRDPRRT